MIPRPLKRACTKVCFKNGISRRLIALMHVRGRYGISDHKRDAEPLAIAVVSHSEKTLLKFKNHYLIESRAIHCCRTKTNLSLSLQVNASRSGRDLCC
jgi:hypothetical protein